MATTHQIQINAFILEKVTTVIDVLVQVKEGCEQLKELRDDHEERLEILESNTSSACTNGNRNASATPPKQACTLDTATENTIRLTCHKELADLVVRLCKYDEDTQKLAVAMLLEGEGKMCSFTSYDPRGSSGPSKRRRR